MIGIVALNSKRRVRFPQDKHGAKRACGCEPKAVGLRGGKEMRKALAVCLVECAILPWTWFSLRSLHTGRKALGALGQRRACRRGCSVRRSWWVAVRVVLARCRDPAGDGWEGNRGTHAQAKDLWSSRKVFSNVKIKENKERDGQTARQYRKQRSGTVG